MKAMMVVLLIIAAVYYYMTEYSVEEKPRGRGFVQQEKPKPKPKGVIPQYQLNALEKARSVEGIINDAAKKQDELIQQN